MTRNTEAGTRDSTVLSESSYGHPREITWATAWNQLTTSAATIKYISALAQDFRNSSPPAVTRATPPSTPVSHCPGGTDTHTTQAPQNASGPAARNIVHDARITL